MSDPLTELGAALEERGYDVAGTSANRSRHRVELLGQQPAHPSQFVLPAVIT